MSKNTVERTEGCHVVSFKADPTVSIPKGGAVSVLTGVDYEVTNFINSATGAYSQGVALQAHASGNYDCIPVLLPGPVLRVLAGTGGVTAGNLVNGAVTPGEWIVDTTVPAGFALEGATAGDEFDICYVGEQY